LIKNSVLDDTSQDNVEDLQQSPDQLLVSNIQIFTSDQEDDFLDPTVTNRQNVGWDIKPLHRDRAKKFTPTCDPGSWLSLIMK
jgi:hypothetical protein